MHIAASYFFAAAAGGLSALAPFGLRDTHTEMHFCSAATPVGVGGVSYFAAAQLVGLEVRNTDVAPKLPNDLILLDNCTGYIGGATATWLYLVKNSNESIFQ